MIGRHFIIMQSPYRLNDEEEIFNEAIQISDTSERARYLDGACRGNADLRSRLEVLLEAQFEEVQFMDSGSDESPLHEQEGSLIGPYKLLQQIGKGGFGVVYMAEQKKPVRRRVALKIIKLGMDTKQVIARFEAERQALAMMDHPNIAKVLDVGATDSGRPYFVMELVRGVAVTDYCDEHRLSTEERLNLFVLICHAIQHAHQKGIIHRDIKPGNVLVNQVDGKVTPKIIDFGVAKATQNDLTDKTLFTRFEQFIGTPAYMSPEQAGMGALDIDTRSDVYALGVLLYELLTGTTPLDARKLSTSAVDEVCRQIREEEAVRPSAAVSTMDDIRRNSTAEHRNVLPQKLTRQLQGDIDWIVLKALEKDRGRRYVTANALAQDLVRFMRNDPVEAMKPSLAYLLKKFAKRHRSVIATISAFAAILIAATTVSVRQAIRAKKEESKAQQSYQVAREARLQAESSEMRERALKEEAEGNAYTAGMRLVRSDWEKDNHSRIKKTLRDLRDYSKKSFEWGYLQRALHLEKARFPTYAGGIKSIDVSPRGERVVLLMNDGTIEVRSLPDGKEIVRIAKHSSWTGQAIFSPDGETIASTSGGEKIFTGQVTLWNARTGEKIRIMGAPGKGGSKSTEPGYMGYRQYALAFSPDGRFLATGGAHSRRGIQLWEVATGKRVRAMGEDWVGRPWISQLIFSADGSRLLCRTSLASYVALYDVETGERLDSIGNPEEPAQVGRISLMAGTHYLAVARGKEISVYDIGNDDFSKVRDTIQTSDRTAPVFSPDGEWLMVRDGSDTHFYEAATFTKRHTIRTDGRATVFVPGSNEVLSRSGRWLKRWDMEGRQMAQVYQTSSAAIIEVSDDGSKAVVIRKDANPVDTAVVDLATGEIETPLAALTPGSGGRFNSQTARLDGAAFSPDGQLTALGSRDGTIRIFGNRGDLRQTISTPSSTPGRAVHHYGLAFGPSAKTIISTDDHDDKNSIAIWDITTGKKIFRTKDRGNQFAINRDETLLASAFGEMVTLWDVKTGEQLLKPWKALEAGQWHGVTSMTFTPDSSYLITAGAGGSIKKWETRTGKLVCRFDGRTSEIARIAVLPDGRRLVSVSRSDGSVTIWDLANGNELLSLTHPLIKSVHRAGLAVSPDGTRITLSKSECAVSWDVATEEQITKWLAEEEEDAEKWAEMEESIQKGQE